jgi:hypothetical protein
MLRFGYDFVVEAQMRIASSLTYRALLPGDRRARVV